MNYIFSLGFILVGLIAISLGLEALFGKFQGAATSTLAGEQGGMLVINSTLIVQSVSYILFMLIMDRVLFRPILAHLDDRKNAVKQAEEAAEAAERAVLEVEVKRQEQMDKAFRKASVEKSKSKAAAIMDYQEAISSARTTADKRVEAARKEAEIEAKAAEEALEGQIGELADLMRDKLTHKESRS